MRNLLTSAALLFLGACASSPGIEREVVRLEASPGVTLHVEVHGGGADVVIAPGRLFFGSDFRALAAPNRTLVMYDMRNRGASARVEDATAITILDDIRDLEAVRAHVGAERVSLIGFSYLGLMTALYAAEHPGRVERLVQIGPVQRDLNSTIPAEWRAGADSLSPEGVAALEAAQAASATATPETDQRSLCEIQRRAQRYWLVGDPANAARVADTCIFENEWPDALSRHFGLHFADLQTREFPAERFAALTQPTLVIHGRLDRNAPYGSGREWASLLNDARLVTIERGAHSVWLDDPGVIEDIDAFLNGEWPARAEALH